jgi:ketosteroid isomerase-like protein
MKLTKGNADTLKGECQMSLEILEAKEAIREVIDGFANLECNVPAQMVYFTEDVHVMVYMGDKLTMDIHGWDTMEKQFSAFIGDIKASHHQNGQQVIAMEGDTATAGRLW